MCYSISSTIWRFKVIKEVEEKLNDMGYNVRLSKDDMLVVTLLSETTDKKQIERILELMSVSAIQGEKFTKEELKDLITNRYSKGLRKLLCYSFLSKEKILDYSFILSRTDDEVLLNCMRDVMCSSSIHQKDEVEESLILLKKSNESYQRIAERNILLNNEALRQNISLELASKVLNSKEEYQARGISELLYDQEELNKEQLLTAADSINSSKSERQAKFIGKLAKDEYYKRTGLLLPTLRIIDEVKEDFQLNYLKRTVGICKEPIILLPSLKLYTQTETREECDLLQKRLSSLKKEDIISSLGSDLSLVSATTKAKVKEKTI